MRRRLVVVTLVVALAGLLAEAPALAAPKPRFYRGTTSQGMKIQFDLVKKRSGTLLFRGFSIGADLTCPDASTQSFGLGLESFPGDPLTGHDLAYDQVDSQMGIHVTGSFHSDAASGTFVLNQATLTADEQAQLCTTGPLTWTAHRTAKSGTGGLIAGYKVRGRVHVHRLPDGAVARWAKLRRQA